LASTSVAARTDALPSNPAVPFGTTQTIPSERPPSRHTAEAAPPTELEVEYIGKSSCLRLSPLTFTDR
jgi:hypothetical protein